MSARLIDAGRFVLRPLEDEDAPAFAHAVRESAASVGRWMDWAHAGYTADEALAWIAQCRRDRVARLAHEFGIFEPATGDFVGGAGLNRIDALHGVANLGYWVRERCRGRGAASDATRALARLAFHALALTRVEIVCADDNEDSQRVARRVGALHEGRLRHRLRIQGRPVPAELFSLVPGDPAL